MKLVIRSWKDIFTLEWIRIKRLVMDRYCMYWTFFFPLLFSFLLVLASGGMSQKSLTQNIPIAVCIENKEWKGLKEYLETVKSSDGEKIFSVSELRKEEAEEKLASKEIYGFVYAKEEVNVYVENMHENECKVESFVKLYIQTHHSGTEDYGNTYISQNRKIGEGISEKATLFFAVLGMACVLGMMWGIKVVSELFGKDNMTSGRRRIAPVKLWKQLLIDTTFVVVLHWMELLVITFFVIYVVKVTFIKGIFICIAAGIGGLFSILAGESYAILRNGTFQKKANNISAMTIFFGLLAGLIVPEAKYFVHENLPVLRYINPIDVISDACYSIYFGNRIWRYFENIFMLVLFCMAALMVIIIQVRRKQNETI